MNRLILIFVSISLWGAEFNYAQTYCAGDSVLLAAHNYISGDIQWQESADHINWSDIQGATTLTYMVYPTTSVYYRLMVTDSSCLPPYPSQAQHVFITPMPTIANAGTDQTNISGTSVTLNANLPIYGLGTWTVISGTGGMFDNISQHNTTFHGVAGTTYLLRWTIENTCGSSYDEVSVSFSGSFACGDILIDSRDSQQYATVLIGSQCWMAKNLNIGQMVLGTANQTNNSIIEKYCYDDLATHCNSHGGMYQWDEMMGYTTTESVQGICPDGWHIPSDNEWKILEISLGMTQAEADMGNTWRGANVGTALKDGGTSGFDALLGGGRWNNGAFMWTGQMGYYWTSTESGTNAWRRCFSSTDHTVGRWDTFSKIFGFHVRCVKN